MPDRVPDVGLTTLAAARRHSLASDVRFRVVAKAVERMPAYKAQRRRKRALAAIGHLRTAIFWRVLADEHTDRPPDTLVRAVVGPNELSALWVEAAERARMAARDGAIAPGRQGRALATAAAYMPGEGKLPKRAA